MSHHLYGASFAQDCGGHVKGKRAFASRLEKKKNVAQ